MNEIPVHPDLEGLSLFDVGETELDRWVGHKVFLIREPEGNKDKRCIMQNGKWLWNKPKWNPETQDVEYLGRPEVFTVGSVQRIYDGSLALRIYGEDDTFGRPAKPEALVPVLQVVKP